MDLQNKSNLAKAVIKVMKAVVGIEKNLNVGTGNSSYKGVSDKDVKNAIGTAMENAGLCILPIGVDAKVQVERWEVESNYGKQQKQQVFTETKTRYLLLHESGESVELEGYGHGVDTQDKSAGKATTYALKNTLLYAFLVPTGKIEDADNDHSDSAPPPPKQQQQPSPPGPTKVDIDAALTAIVSAKDLPELQKVWKGIPAAIQNVPDVLSTKEKQKITLKPAQA